MKETPSWLRRAHWVLLGLELLLLPMMAVAVYAGRSMTAAWEESLDTELPLLTQWMLAMPPWVFLIVFVLVVAFIIAKERIMPLGMCSLAIDLAISAAVCVFAALLVLAMFLPMVAAYKDLSSLSYLARLE